MKVEVLPPPTGAPIHVTIHVHAAPPVQETRWAGPYLAARQRIGGRWRVIVTNPLTGQWRPFWPEWGPGIDAHEAVRIAAQMNAGWRESASFR